MTRNQNSLDNGTQGAQITAANSGTSGTAFTQAFGTGVLTYNTGSAITGTKGALAESASSVAAISADIPASAAAGFSLEFNMPSLPGSDFHIARLVATSDTRVVSIHLSNTNRLRFSDLSGTANGVWTATNPITAGTAYRVELWAKAGSTSTTGELRGAYYLAGSTTPIETFTINTAQITVGTPFVRFIWGRITTSTIQTSFDSPVWENEGTGLPGPYAVPLATPVVTLGTTTNPTTVGGTDGKQVITWASIAGAATYQVYRAAGASPAQGDFTLIASGLTALTYEYTGLAAGTYSFGVKAKAS